MVEGKQHQSSTNVTSFKAPIVIPYQISLHLLACVPVFSNGGNFIFTYQLNIYDISILMLLKFYHLKHR